MARIRLLLVAEEKEGRRPDEGLVICVERRKMRGGQRKKKSRSSPAQESDSYNYLFIYSIDDGDDDDDGDANK